MTLIREIDAFLRSHAVPASTFGREALGDPSFVHQLRRGREPRPRTAARVRAYIDRVSSCRG